MADSDSSLSGPACDDVEYTSQNINVRGRAPRGRSEFDHLSEYDEGAPVGDEMWGEDDDFGEFDQEDAGDAFEEQLEFEQAGAPFPGGEMDGAVGDELEEEYGYDEEPDWEDAEFYVCATMIPAALAAKGADSVEWHLRDLYSKPFSNVANKGMLDDAALGGISLIAMRHNAPFSLTYRVSMPEEDSKKSFVKSLKKGDAKYDIENDRIVGNTHLGEHVKYPVHGVLGVGESLEEEIPCLSSPAGKTDVSFLSKQGKSHWSASDMASVANGVHYFKNKPGLVCLEPDHPVAKLTENYYPDDVTITEDLSEVTKKDFNKYVGILIRQHKAFMTLGDARRNLQFHFTRYIPPDSTASSKSKSLDAGAWASESEICDSISTTDSKEFEKAKERQLNKTYTVTAKVLVQFAPRNRL